MRSVSVEVARRDGGRRERCCARAAEAGGVGRVGVSCDVRAHEPSDPRLREAHCPGGPPPARESLGPTRKVHAATAGTTGGGRPPAYGDQGRAAS